jgi:hypothetical protein
MCSIGCRRRSAPTPKGNASASASAERNRPLPPLQARERIVTLAQRGMPNAELLLPVGATTTRPLVAILLPTAEGLRQRCEALGRSISADAFVLCQSAEQKNKLEGPRQVTGPGKEAASAQSAASAQPAVSGQVDIESISSSLQAALRMAMHSYGRYVSSKELALVGVDEGAAAVAPIVREAPDFFRRVALLGGGFQFWSSVDSVRFVRAGAKALLARCTREQCRGEAMRVVATVRALGTATRLVPEVSLGGVAGGGADPADEPHLLLRWLLVADSAAEGRPAGVQIPDAGSNVLGRVP